MTHRLCLFFISKNQKERKKDVKVFYVRFRTSGARAVDDVSSKFLIREQWNNCSPWIWKADTQEREEGVLPIITEQFKFDTDIGYLNSYVSPISYDQLIASCF